MFNMRLKRARKTKGITQAEIAKMLYISQAAYSKYETGVASPNPETLARIAEILDVSVDYLTNGDSPSSSLTMDDFTFAMHGHSGQLTDKDKEILLAMAKQLSDAHKKGSNGEADGDL